MTKKQKAIAAGTLALAAGAYFLPLADSEPTYAVVKWIARSNGVVVAGIPTVVSYSTNLRDWVRIATNSTGSVTVATDSPQAFFRVEPL